MKRHYLINSLGFVLPLVFIADATAAMMTLNFSGSIDSVVDASAPGTPPIDFAPIPVGSFFSGQFTYSSSAPEAGGGTGYACYGSLAPSSHSVTINGFDFSNIGNPFMTITSQEAGYGYSGVDFGSQPILLPAGWSVENPQLAYITVCFFSEPAQSQSLAPPTVASDFPLGSDYLVLDFQEPVTVGGETFGDRVYVTGIITSFTLSVPEPSTLVLLGIGAIGLLCWWRKRATRAA